MNWSCGANCNANPRFLPIASGGDGAVIQFWYVGYDPIHATIIVAHQGTDISKIIPVLTDVDLFLTPLSQSLFPGIGHDVEAHNGFLNEQAATSAKVFGAVQTGLKQHNVNSVTFVGHSLGAAISLLDAVSLKVRLPSTTVKFYGFGLPRVGNQAFANYVDAHLSSFSRITNLKDPVPVIPGRFLGFHHPSGEAHIDSFLSQSWKNCPGQDNTDSQCSIGDTSNLFVANENNHAGPYDGVHMGC